MKSTKIRFNRDSKLSAKRIHHDNVISSITYENGTINIINNGFITQINNVDELIMVMKPLDEFITSISFRAENYDGNIYKIYFKMIGIIGEHIKIEAENEIREDDEKNERRGKPGRPKKKDLLIKKIDIPD